MWICLPEQTGTRIDVFVSEQNAVTRSAAQGLIERGAVTVNGAPVAKNYKLRAGDAVDVEIPEPVAPGVVAQAIPLDIVYEDDDLLVVNKPKGMVVHPAAGNPDGTLVNALLAHCGDSLSGINGVTRPGIVHRIDKDTSGLLMVAKNDFAHQGLAAQIQDHSFLREYEAVVVGHLKQSEGTVDAPIGRNPGDRKKMAVTAGGRPAVTQYRVLREYRGYTRVLLRLYTGRTHQIRVHMAHIGHPVAGDAVYGGGRQPRTLHGQCLHAGTLGFVHPRTGAYMEFHRDPPQEFSDFLEHLEKQ